MTYDCVTTFSFFSFFILFHFLDLDSDSISYRTQLSLLSLFFIPNQPASSLATTRNPSPRLITSPDSAASSPYHA
jgi:hypothetical protein